MEGRALSTTSAAANSVPTKEAVLFNNVFREWAVRIKMFRSCLFPRPLTRERGLFWKFCFSLCPLVFLGYRSLVPKLWNMQQKTKANKEKTLQEVTTGLSRVSRSLHTVFFPLPSESISVALYIFLGFSFFATVGRIHWCVLTPVVGNQKSDSRLIVAILLNVGFTCISSMDNYVEDIFLSLFACKMSFMKGSVHIFVPSLMNFCSFLSFKF